MYFLDSLEGERLYSFQRWEVSCIEAKDFIYLFIFYNLCSWNSLYVGDEASSLIGFFGVVDL